MTTKARNDGGKDGLGEEEIEQKVVEATPAYLRGRMEGGELLPEAVVLGGVDGAQAEASDDDDMVVDEEDDQKANEKERLVAAVKFVLDADRFRQKWFVELLDTMMMPWDAERKRA